MAGARGILRGSGFATPTRTFERAVSYEQDLTLAVVQTFRSVVQPPTGIERFILPFKTMRYDLFDKRLSENCGRSEGETG